MMRRRDVQKRLIAGAERLAIVCDDCGRERRWSRARIERLPAGMTVEELGRLLYCAECRNEGGLGGNVEVRPKWPR